MRNLSRLNVPDTPARTATAFHPESSPTVDISVIVMAYNEAATVAGVLGEIEAVMEVAPYTYEIIVVDDGSSDATGAIAEAAVRGRASVRVLHHQTNLGIGEVYRSGFGAAKGEFLTFLPADGQFPATIVPEFAGRMADADLVLGYLPGVKRSILATALSLAERSLYRMMFGHLPRFQGIMMFRRALLTELGVKLGGRGWGVLMEIIVRAVSCDKVVISVPTLLRDRTSGSSKVNNLRSVRANLMQAAALWWSLHFTPRRSEASHASNRVLSA